MLPVCSTRGFGSTPRKLPIRSADFGGHIWPSSALGLAHRLEPLNGPTNQRFLDEKVPMPGGPPDGTQFRAEGAAQRRTNSLRWASVAAEMGQVKLPEAAALQVRTAAANRR